MSRIAILDSWVDPKRVSPRRYEYINVCSQKSDAATEKPTHGTVCAVVLDHCTSDYELINIQVTPNYSGSSIKTYGDAPELIHQCAGQQPLY